MARRAASSRATWSPARSNAHRRRRGARHRRLRQRFYLSTNAKGCNTTAIWRAHKRGALFANPCFTQIHPTCIPVSGEYQSKLTLMSESLRNDGRIWVPERRATSAPPARSPKRARLFPGAQIPQLRQPGAARRGLAQRQAGVRRRPRRGRDRPRRLPRFSDAIQRLGKHVIKERYGNLFDMYQRITGEDPTRSRCASTPPSTTPWAACGWTTT
jgi:succinate dehydrogenase / fumarate reductase, flavoprotein subunit